MSLLDVDALTVRYGALLAVESVGFSIDAGGSVSILGANGAGKTTVLRAISGLLRYHGGTIAQGTVRFDGRDITGSDCSALVRRGIAQVLEGRHIFADLTVADNLRAGAFASGRAATATRDHVLDLFPQLRDRLSVAGGLLSGGEQQMLAIGRALMARPRLLLLDEPSLGLAPLVVRRIGDALRAIRDDGVSLLVVEQSTALALATTDHAVLLENGRAVRSDATAQLLGDESVRRSYLGTTAGGDLVAAETAS